MHHQQVKTRQSKQGIKAMTKKSTTAKKTAAKKKNPTASVKKVDVPKKAMAKAGGRTSMAKRGKLASNRSRGKKKKLKGISDIRRFFYTNKTPIYFISATNFNLLNIDEWVRNFRFINYINCFDYAHPNAFIPDEFPHEPFESIEDIVNYLLQHKQVVDYINFRGPGGKAAFLFFDEKTEELAKELKLDVCFPKAKLREKVDDKVSATRIGKKAKVPSVPNVIAKVKSYEELRKVSKKLGDDLVVQSSFGDSGHTTFFISNEKDWKKHEKDIIDEKEVKIMKRINCRQTAIEACVTRCGTIVGPLMTELVGFKELTPYKGGWCGNEVFADAFTKRIRNQARKMTQAFGEELRKMGFRGYFEIDFLLDEDSGKLYMGEVNPRLTGASSITNLSAFAHSDAPLFLFHLLEYMDIDFEIDVDELNARWSDPDNIDAWSQLVIKYTDDSVELIEEAPRSGVWNLRDDFSGLDFVRVQTHRRTVERENAGFFLRIAEPGSYLYEGADIGILLTPGRLMDDDFRLTARAQAWVSWIRKQFVSRPLVPDEVPLATQKAEVGGFKML